MSINTWNIYTDSEVGTLSGNITNKEEIETIFYFAKGNLLHMYNKRVKKYEVRKNKIYVFDRKYINRWTDGYVWNDSHTIKLGMVYKQCSKVRKANGKIRKVKVDNGLTKMVAISKCGRYGLANYY